ncbi:uncharacterized protein [Rhodnius prolixus]|uniref:uncharacterized protein n=1 Tax=Rhodnius prolixus TaxID=13249 RepID=UPI003D1885DA
METRTALALALLVGAGNALLPSTTTTNQDTALQDPNYAINGIYTECVLSFSFPCLQRKALLFIERMGRSQVFPLVGDFISLVRTTSTEGPPLSEDKLRYLNGDQLADMIDTSISDFFQNHVFRLKLPNWVDKTVESRGDDNSLDFYVGDTENVEEGRKKSGGKKGMKKMMMMMCMMMAGKVMMLGPMMLGLTKLAAIKALILSFISLTISKIIILKKLKSQKGGGGGGGGWSSGGGGGGGAGWSSGGGGGGGGGWQSSGGGWDRSFSNHDLVYSGHLGNT